MLRSCYCLQITNRLVILISKLVRDISTIELYACDLSINIDSVLIEKQHKKLTIYQIHGELQTFSEIYLASVYFLRSRIIVWNSYRI